MKAVLVFLIVLVFSFTAVNAIEFEDAIFPELATTGRALAMGNAYINRTADSVSTFYNPAGLGTVRYPHIHLSNIHLETNKGWLDVGTGGQITDTFSNFSKGFSVDGSRELLVENRGKITHSRFHVVPNFTARYFTMGYLYSMRTRTYLGKEVDDPFEYADRTDHGPYGGINISMMGGVFKVGASLILLNRKEIISEAEDPTQTITLEDDDYKQGTALISTVGARLIIPVVYLPTFSAVIHNAASTRFTHSGAGRPDAIKQSMDVAFSITPQLSKGTRFHLEVDYKDLTGKFSDVTTARKILIGMEFDFYRVMFVRFGYGDGYGSCGLGIKSKKLEFDLTTYAVDTTSSSFRGAEDRRFSMTISSGF